MIDMNRFDGQISLQLLITWAVVGGGAVDVVVVFGVDGRAGRSSTQHLIEGSEQLTLSNTWKKNFFLNSFRISQAKERGAPYRRSYRLAQERCEDVNAFSGTLAACRRRSDCVKQTCNQTSSRNVTFVNRNLLLFKGGPGFEIESDLTAGNHFKTFRFISRCYDWLNVPL